MCIRCIHSYVSGTEWEVTPVLRKAKYSVAVEDWELHIYLCHTKVCVGMHAQESPLRLSW